MPGNNGEPSPNDFLSIRVVNFSPSNQNDKFGIKHGEMENMIDTLEREDLSVSEWLTTNVGKLVDAKIYGQGKYNRSSEAANWPIYYQKNKNNPNSKTYYFPYDTAQDTKGGSGAGKGTRGTQVFYAVVQVETDMAAYNAALKEWDKLESKKRLTERDEAIKLQKEEQKRKLEEERQILAEERERRLLEKEKLTQQKDFDNEDQLEKLEEWKAKWGDYPTPTAEIAVEKPSSLFDILRIFGSRGGRLTSVVYTTAQESASNAFHPGVAYAGPNIWENLFPNQPYPIDGPIITLVTGKPVVVTQGSLPSLGQRIPGIAGLYAQAKAAISQAKEANVNKYKKRRV